MQARVRMLARTSVPFAPEVLTMGGVLRGEAIDARWLDLGNRISIVFRPSHEDRTRGLAHDLFRHGSQEPSLDSPATVRSDDDQVGTEIRCELQDRLPRQTGRDVWNDSA